MSCPCKSRLGAPTRTEIEAIGALWKRVWLGSTPRFSTREVEVSKSTLKTVRAHVQTLVEAGRLQYAEPGENVHPETLELTATERKDRAMDARVKVRK